MKAVNEFYDEPIAGVPQPQSRDVSNSPPHGQSVPKSRDNSNPKSTTGSYKNELSDYSKNIWNDLP